MSPMLIGTLSVVVIGLGVATWKAPRLTSTLIWSLVATIMISVAVIKLIPGEPREPLMFSVAAMPVFWAAIQFWCYWDSGKWRVVGGLFAATAVSTGLFFAL